MPKETDYSLENTEKLRDFEETISVKMPENKENKENLTKTEGSKEKSKNEVDKTQEKPLKKQESGHNNNLTNPPEDITSHYKNLNQALNDFFSSEEGEEESENESEGKK